MHFSTHAHFSSCMASLSRDASRSQVANVQLGVALGGFVGLVVRPLQIHVGSRALDGAFPEVPQLPCGLDQVRSTEWHVWVRYFYKHCTVTCFCTKPATVAQES